MVKKALPTSYTFLDSVVDSSLDDIDYLHIFDTYWRRNVELDSGR